jgi:hypothetical protein
MLPHAKSKSLSVRRVHEFWACESSLADRKTTCCPEHHWPAFTLDVYARALPQQMDEAGKKVADIITAASGSILVANSPTLH